MNAIVAFCCVFSASHVSKSILSHWNVRETEKNGAKILHNFVLDNVASDVGCGRKFMRRLLLIDGRTSQVQVYGQKICFVRLVTSKFLLKATQKHKSLLLESIELMNWIALFACYKSKIYGIWWSTNMQIIDVNLHK